MKQLRIRAAMTVALVLACGCTVEDKGPRQSTGGVGQGGTGLASSTHSSSGTMEGVGGAGGNAGAGGSVGGAGGSGGDGGAMAGCSSNLDCGVLLSNIVPQGCVNALCDTATGACSFSTIDADGDGHGTAVCMADGATIVPGDDCDDTDPLKFPGAWDGPEDPMAGVADQCNGVDNDCDGTTDDDNVGSASCICDPATNVNVPCHERPDGTPIMFPGGTPQGSCLAGVKNCVAGAWESCIGALEPLTVDTCTAGNDDNCNGIPNEGCACIAGATSTCAALFGSGGVCGSTTVTCDASGHWPQVCPTVPSSELCNGDGLDEDCDGFVNDGCACAPGTTATCAAAFGSQGVCGNGLVTCGADGKWPMQCPAAASLELCNGDGLDEDCDGFVNDGCECLTGQTTACGACGLGVKSCNNGAWSDCANSTAGLVVAYRDADGDGYCNKANVVVVCGVPSGYLSTSCLADCNDNNGYARDACVTLFNKSAEAWQKPWANPACGGHTWTVCPVGFHTSSCYAFRVNGGGHINPPSWSGTTCTLNICDDGFETATVYPGGTCEANP